MINKQITIVRSSLPFPRPALDELIVTDDEVRAWVRGGRVFGHLLRYREGRLLTERLATAGRPMLAWALRLMTRDRCYIADCEGRQRDVTLGLLLRWSWQVLYEAATTDALLRGVSLEVENLDRAARTSRTPVLDRTAPPVYLRTDLSFGVRAGGSVGHIAGVVNELADAGFPPILLTTAPVPTVRPDVETHHVAVPERFWNFRELPTFVLNDVFFDEARRAIADRRVSFVYQRYSLNNYAGLKLARHLSVPFVVEYNGSEIWMSRHWGCPLKHESLASRIELLNVNAADLVVVVSRAMRDELVRRSVDANRILINPNAVDPERYSPNIGGEKVRARYDLSGRLVIGFIGTFQPWHGADVLGEAFAQLLRDRPGWRENVRLVMIGDGPGAAVSKQQLAAAGLERLCTFTGLVAQEEGPEYLAACDIFAAPHVPNPDGTPFFGSPTKLFEYMAMGKAIVASDLDQIGEVLRHGETAWLVPPANSSALAGGLARLVDDVALRRTLGESARLEAVAHYTWRTHVRKTIDALESRVRARVA